MRNEKRYTLNGIFCRLLVLIAIPWLAGCTTSGARHYDLVVYGGSAGGVVTAVAAAREGASVVLLEPRRHVGGLVSGGLGATDFGNKHVIGGMSLSFFEELGKHYGESVTWYFEPHVAEDIYRRWLADAGVEVLYEHRLADIRKQGNRIVAIRMENGAAFAGKVFADCSYEGDLMACANVSYTWGRESGDQYGESLAGVRDYSKYHQFDVPVQAHDERGNLLPGVFAGERGEPEQGDRKVQAYNFRICMCNRKENQIPFPEPADYDPGRYEILRRYLAQKGTDITLKNILSIKMMPNGKTDVNNNGPISTDHIGANWDYPEADYKRRQEIWDDHVSYVQGLLYFLANDPSVPKHIQDEMNLWGLAKDEFVDTGHWPHQMYIREARRMIGEYVMIQKDLQDERTKPDSIGMGSYNSDSHHVQRVVRLDGTLENEGDMQVPVKPYEIAYRAIVPRQAECPNLFVPVCFSASHVAYSSMRMEPQYMIMGHAAGVAAAYAIKNEVPVQKVDIAWLQARLREQGQILSVGAASAPHVGIDTLPGFVIDNSAATVTGQWPGATSVGPFVGLEYLHDGNVDKGTKSVRFVPDLPQAQRYEVWLAYSVNPNRATNVPVTVNAADGAAQVTLNQRKAPSRPPFERIGAFSLPAGKGGWVEIGTADTDGYVIADAVQWIPAKP